MNARPKALRLRCLPLVLAHVLGCGSGESVADSPATDAGSDSEALAPSEGSTALLDEAQHIVATLTSTHYQHDSHIDAPRGVFDVDCSGFVDYALETSASGAFTTFQHATVTRPLAASYITFFDELSPPRGSWHEIQYVRDLVPGDIISWKIPPQVKSSDTGHVMIVEAVTDVTGSAATIRVIDSTDTGHGDVDPRNPKGPSGIGRGTVALTMAADGTATGYRWSLDSDSPAYDTDVEMAHLD